MNPAAKKLGALMSTLFIYGCVQGQGATPSEGVRVRSDPEGATVQTSFGDTCISPCTIFLPTKSGGDVTISKDGFETQTTTIGTKFDKVGVALDAPNVADPASAAVSAGFLAIFGKSTYRNLDRHRLKVTLVPMDESNAEAASASGQ